MLSNIIVIAIVAAIIIAAITKILIDKKNGIKCSGCPHSKTCSSKCQTQSNPIMNGEFIQDAWTNKSDCDCL